MIKGLIGSLIAAAVFFTAGGMTVAIMGTDANPLKSFEKFGDDFDNLLLDSDTDGTWYFDNTRKLALGLSSTKAVVKPIEGDQISLSVSSNDASIGIARLSVRAALNSDGSCLAISVSHGSFFIIDMSSITTEIGLPKSVYDKLTLSLGSGSVDAQGLDALENEITVGSGKLLFKPNAGFTADSMELSMGSGIVDAEGVNALENEIAVGSGKLMFSQSADFTANSMHFSMGSGIAEITSSAAEYLDINIGSGSLKMDTSKTERFDIEMGSGKFEVNGLSGSGSIDVSSGIGTARFSDAGGINGTELELSSGRLSVYLPNDTNAQINTDISSGSVDVDCCGVKEKLRSDDEFVILGKGGAEIDANVSSGKLSILENDTVISQITMTGDAVSGTGNT